MTRFLEILLITILALVLVNSARGSFSPATLNDTMSWLAQRPVKARCLTEKETNNDPNLVYGAVAYVKIKPWGPDNKATIGYPWCKNLLDQTHMFNFAVAVLVITHESGHLRGGSFPAWLDEGVVNCWAVRRAPAVAQLRFGLPPELVPAFKKQLYKEYNWQPAEYRVSGCLKGQA